LRFSDGVTTTALELGYADALGFLCDAFDLPRDRDVTALVSGPDVADPDAFVFRESNPDVCIRISV
jgi:hypothetical protein